ncbi:MAG: AAC(3) family N-acetyltransferase [Lentisphaeria bacterium]|nr:AAC(3) family N-acetyltransferase [Lentisphaeria bacterium]
MNKQDIASGLRGLGLAGGDKVLLHSSLSSLGKVEGGPDAVIDAFLEVLGREGTLLVPVFGALGVITETLKKRPGAVISSAPAGTLAALGRDAEVLLRDHWRAETAHGKDTPFTRLADMGGYVCLLGVDQDRNTSLHSAEALLQLPYLGNETCTFTSPDGRNVTKTYRYYPGPHRNFIGLDRVFREAGIMKTRRIGSAQVRLMKSADMLRIALELGKKDPAFALCGNPACEDCVRQRAAIFSDRLKHESFRLAASSRLAGRYVPEMIENLHAAGIGYVELDHIQGRPCALTEPAKLASAVKELTAEGIGISALSCYASPDAPEKLVELVKTAGIERVILPVGAREAAELLLESGIAADLRNINHTARTAARAVNDFNGRVRACLNPANLAAAGDRPFRSFRQERFARITGQLDLCDALWDGSARPPAQGNGEVKELVSILRCRNFDGWFCLGGGSVCPGTLARAAADFAELLDNM